MTTDLFSEETKEYNNITFTFVTAHFCRQIWWSRGGGALNNRLALIYCHLASRACSVLSCWKDFLLSQDREDAISISHTTILVSSYFIVDSLTGSDRNGLRWSFKVQGRVKRPQLILSHRDYNRDEINISGNKPLSQVKKRRSLMVTFMQQFRYTMSNSIWKRFLFAGGTLTRDEWEWV